MHDHSTQDAYAEAVSRFLLSAGLRQITVEPSPDR